MTHEKVYCTPKGLLEFSNFCSLKPRGYMWEWIYGVWFNGGRNIKLEQAKFIDMGSLSRGSAFNVAD